MKKTKEKRKSELIVKFAKGNIKRIIKIKTFSFFMLIEKRKGNKLFKKDLRKNLFGEKKWYVFRSYVFAYNYKKLSHIKPKAKKRRGNHRG